MSDTLMYAQGQLATITAEFVTAVGMPIDVSDATIEIFGESAAVILAATPMLHTTPMGTLPTGLYYYDYLIPNSLPVFTYTIRISGTVLGIPTVMTAYLQVLPAGTVTPVSSSQKAIGLVAALSDRYLDCALHIPVYRELGQKNRTGTQVRFTWPDWNLSNHIVRINGEQVDTGYSIDLDAATVTFAAPLHSTDEVDATYNFRYFTDQQLMGYLADAISQINVEPPQGIVYTVDNFPDQFIGVLLQGAAANAIKNILFCINYQEQQLLYGGKDGYKDAVSNFQALKENFEKEFREDKKTLKTKSPYPKISGVIQPEYTLPGGRSRWFRYLFSNGTG